MTSLSAINGAASTFPGAIIGENPNPSCAYQAANNSPNSPYLTTGTLAALDPGDLSGSSGATVEFWFMCRGTPAATRHIMVGPEPAHSAGNRQWGFDLTTTRTIQFYVRNTAGTATTLTSVTALAIDNWYYLAGALDSGNLRLYVNAVNEASNPFGTIDGIASSGNLDMRVNEAANDVTCNYDEIAIHRRFLGATRISAHYQAGVNMGFAEKLSGARMIDVLDDCASVHAPRSLQVGQRHVVESYEAGQSPMSELQKARDADHVDALLFVSASGVITYLDAAHRSSSPYNTIQATYGDAGGTELPYLDLDVDYSDAFIVNEWDVTRTAGRKVAATTTDGETQTASDATSISRYFKRSQSLGDVPVIQDSDALNIATDLLAKYKDPMYRIQSIILSTANADVAFNTFRRDIGDKIRVLRTPPGGGARIQEDLWIQKIEITADAQSPIWTIRLGVSPL